VVGALLVATWGTDTLTTLELPAVEVVALDAVVVEEVESAPPDAARVHAVRVAAINTTKPGTVLIVFKDRPGAQAPRLAITDKKRGRALSPSPFPAKWLGLRADQL
jgi:hypothetical protein